MFFSSDCYKDGYENGLNDALKGKDRDYLKFRAKFLIYGDNSIKTFNDGYDTGYTDGLRLKMLRMSDLKVANDTFTERDLHAQKPESNIFNSDCYQDGYVTGRAEALAGEDRDDRKIRLKFLIYGANSIKTFNDGYYMGYRDGLNEKAVKEYIDKNQPLKQETKQIVNNNSNSNKMSRRISVSRDAVMELITQLGKYKADLDIVRQNLEWGLNKLEEDWNDEDFQRYKAEALKVVEEIMRVSDAMLDNDLIPRTMNYYQQIDGIQFR